MMFSLRIDALRRAFIFASACVNPLLSRAVNVLVDGNVDCAASTAAWFCAVKLSQ
jgi:hypothetical protein